MRLFTTITFTVLVATTTSASAGLAEWLGLDKAAREAGKEAAVEFVKGVDIATRNIVQMTNQFGQLISDLDNPNPAIREHARATLRRVLGKDYPASEASALQVTASFDGVAPGSDMQADILLFAGKDDEYARKAISDTSSLKPNRISNFQALPRTKDSLAVELKSQLKAYLSEHGRSYGEHSSRVETILAQKCTVVPVRGPGSAVQAARAKCRREAENELIVEELSELLLLPYRTQPALPIAPGVRRNLPGGTFATIVATEAALRASPNLKMTAWVHVAGDNSKAVGDFQSSRPEYLTSDFLKSCLPSNREAIGRVCYVWVRLGLDGLMNYDRPTK